MGTKEWWFKRTWPISGKTETVPSVGAKAGGTERVGGQQTELLQRKWNRKTLYWTVRSLDSSSALIFNVFS